ncbi:ferrous iron transport protein A [[Pseudomonas] carboxydohydrogena]|uniref:Ferrous iron transport protein A n=1 Tax=Afipia carboxydohydrogena TaxID=290 RepID=A0ABY8BN66_AFICR|nr:FeoA family protein [[Pseudomonas] carboxydohydrogena]WEF51413.1 ferrous iron transport protein A [[Pseudomonas] carboxydohydrogena]
MNDDHKSNGNAPICLGKTPRGFRGLIETITVAGDHNGVPAAEIERRLLELGFVEGARVEVLHEGPIAGDPIAVRIDNNTVALRRREAMSIFVA